MSVDRLNDGEFKTSVSHRKSFGSLDVLAVQGYSSNDLDGIRLSSVVTSHFLVELWNSTIERSVSEFLVHVVDGSSGLVFKNDSVGLNAVGVLFIDFVDRENSSLWSFNLLELSHVVPK